MAASRGGVVHIPWYATGMRGDKLQSALEEIAPSLFQRRNAFHRLELPADPSANILQDSLHIG